MYGVILTAHGKFAEGIYSGVKLVAGEQENVRVCNFEEGEGFEEIDGKIKKALEELSDYEGVLILTDLAGGTPFNRSVMLTQEVENSLVFSGLNFQMLYTAIFAQGDLKDVREEIITEGRNGIDYFALDNEDENDIEDGEGI